MDLKNLKQKLFFIILALMLAAIMINSCGDKINQTDTDTEDENLNIDYSIHKLEEKLTWLSNDNEPIIASPNAKKGGTFNSYILTFPLTFRTIGPDANNYTRTYFLENQLSVISYNEDTDKIMPELATHWAYGKDGKTMYFKINPEARWSDGTPVTADDFIFTIEFMRSKHINDPWYNDYYTNEIEKVTKYDDHLISVTASKKIPDLWLTVGISPTPKHFYGKLNKGFVSDYNWSIEPNTGPYILKEYSKGKYLLFERKKDWWAKDLRYNQNRFNVDYFKLTVIRDDNVALEHFKKGNLDTFGATRAEIWYQKATGEVFDKGYINKLWYYNQARRPTFGLYLNLDKEIFKDKNLRYALAHSINFDKINKQLLWEEASRMQTFYTGYGKYTNTKVRAREFNLAKVDSLMKASGWKKGNDGIWEKDGNRFSVTITYGQPLLTPRVEIMKEEAKKGGIELKLELLDPSTSYKKVMEKKHDVAYMGWSTSFRPSPWQSFHSDNAHKPQTNNINNLNDPEMDRLINRYRESTDERELITLSHKIQERISESGGWVPLDILPFTRAFYWRWIRIPEIPGYKTTSDIFSYPAAGGYFWIDEDIKKETLDAMKSNKSFTPVVNIIDKYK
ncbi:MAG: extracellular solute-binding protein [Leptospirales bacterium]|nr:extracellular solute-binding protein [Leptospirales bacterium]